MLSKLSVKRPYTVLVAVLLVIVLGVVSISRMTTDLLPDMSLQYALIITTDVGASPETVESDVTAPIEAAMATTSNIKNITSYSYNSYSIVTCEYEQNANMDSVVIEIQQQLDTLSAGWDDGIGNPTIMQINPDMLPILMATVDVKDYSKSELTDYVEHDLVPAIESIEGVASVTATGALKEQVQVTLNQEKIDALNEKIVAEISKQFEDAQKELDEATNKVNDGQKQLDDSSKQLSDGMNSINEQKEKLYKTESDLKKQLSTLKDQKKSLSSIVSSINKFMASDTYQGLLSLEDAIAQAKAGGQEEVAAALQAQLKEADKQIASQFAGLSAMGISVKSYKDLPAASAEVAKMLTQVNTGITSIEKGLEQVESGKVSLSEAMNTMNSNASLAAIQMGAGYSQLAVAAQSLSEGQEQLDSAKESALESADMNSVLTIDTLSGILTAQNFNMPAGYVSDKDNNQYLVKVGDEVSDVDELKSLPLMDLGLDGIDTILLEDVADIEMTDNSGDSYAMVNGNPGIILSMEKQTGYSTGDVTDRILDKFDALEKENKDLNLGVLMNQGIYIDMVVKSVVENMIFGAILAIIVLLLFLRDIKPTIVIACSIPLSVVFAIVLMYFTNISLNIISMSGLMLGIGMLVDNSIVVIENIYRLRAEGYSIKKAAVQGASQVAGAIFASTLTTVSVYAPIIFTQGITRQLFVDLALTIAFTLMASLLVALTFVPALSTVTLRNTKVVNHHLFERFKDWYGKVLERALHRKALVFILSIGLLVGSAALSLSRGLSFMDMDMEVNQMTVTLSAKEGENLKFDELTALSDEFVQKVIDIEGIETIGATAGGSSTMNLMNAGSSSSVSIYIIVDDDHMKEMKEIEKEIHSRTDSMDCEIETTTSAMDYSAYFGTGISIQVKGYDLDTLQELAGQVSEILSSTKGLENVQDGLDNSTPELRITVDKEKAAKYGLTVAQVYQEVYKKMADTKSATTISAGLNDYEVYIQSSEQSEITVDDIKKLTYTYTDKEGNEEEIPLTDFASITETSTLSTIYRDAQTRYINVTAEVDEDHNVTLLSNQIKEKIKKIDLPEGYSIEMAGEDQTINDSMNQLSLMLLLAVIFIYLIMVAQFQSLLSPFIIMFSIPLAFTGGFFAIWLSGAELDVISMLGFIMLSGLIVNNGIVLIDYINQQRREGVSKHDAIIEAGKTRIRPILMTALTTILAMSTSALGIGSGSSDMMKPMAISIIGGLVYGTVLTLIVIPCIYDAFNKEKSMVEEEL